MPISVTCPECAYRFHVDEAFAGRPGRCPECDAVIQVPAIAEEDPFSARTEMDEFPSASRRAVEPPSYQSAPRKETRFDPAPRIEKWKKVSAGFRNLAIAAGLIAIDTAIRGTFNLVNGLPKDDEMTSAQKALMVGNGLFTALAIILWAVGRIGLAKTPFLPASGLAKSSGVLAGLTAIPGVLGVGLAAAGIIIAPDNLMAGMAMIQFGGCGVCLFGLGWFVSEIVGLMAQIRITKGLGDNRSAALGKLHLAALISSVAIGTIGFCALIIVLMGQVQQQQQQMQQQGGKQANPPIVAGKNAPKNAPANPNNNPPLPPFNPEDHKELITVLIVVVAGGTIAFAMLCVFSFLAAQGTVRREIARLSGEADGHADDWHNRSPAHHD